MKKGLSVLLIAAALFGFYGGAVNLNDVLACKDYWEEEGERSTADMNKLEDGLNQLKDNEQAYLDGLDALAAGEEALAQGEEDYAAGQAELAKGEADYAAAPGKLADARKQIAQGEKDLAAGEDKLAAGYADYAKGQETLKAGEASLADGYAQRKAGQQSLAAAIANRAALKKVTDKIADVEEAYKPWLQDFGKLRASIIDNPENPSSGVLYDAGAVAVGLSTVAAGFDKIKENSDAAAAGAAQAKAGMDQIEAGVKAKLIEAGIAEPTDEQVQEAIQNSEEYKDKYNGAKATYEKYSKLSQDALALYNHLVTSYKADLLTTANDVNTNVVEKVKGATYQATELRNSDLATKAENAEALLDKILADPYVAGNAEMLAELIGGLNQVKGLAAAAQSSASKYNSAYDELKPEKATNIGSKVASAASAILSTPDIVAKLDGKQTATLKTFTTSAAITELPNVELLYGTMTLGQDGKDDGENSLLDSFRALGAAASGGIEQYDAGIAGGQAQLREADAALAAGEAELAAGRDKLAQGAKDLAKGEKDLAAGKAKLADGKAQYAQGLKDFAAAPAKLEAGRAALAEGLQKLMDGRAELAEGKKKLAEYEDGEQQVRDGLATLMGTAPDGGLTSILDRRNGDDDFDNGDNHLELDEGLEAVEVGRGYQADSGVLITKEITKRAVGTAAGLGAGALAVLAAILSFLKKNKGAGISAILSAVAGGASVAAGTSAGMEFSNIAGSTVGAVPWIAFGVLAGVALVHAIAHFASKEA